MQKTRRLLSVILMLAAILCIAVACAKEPGEHKDVPKELLGEYYAAGAETENILKIEEGGSFTFEYEGQTKSGSVTYEDKTLVLKVDGASIATGTLEQNAIKLQYNGVTLNLLKKIGFSLTFDSKGGSEIAAQTVINGKTPVLPADPTREGHKFVAWYADEDCKTLFDFSQPMTASKTAYALWSKMEYETEFAVSFDLNYAGAPTLDPVQTIGNRLFDLQAPVREGYVFKGWYVSQYYTAEKPSYLCREAETVIREDTTLYAFWQAEDAQLQAPAITVNGSNVTWNPVEGAGVTYQVTVKGPDGSYIKKDEATSNPLIAGVITGAGDYEITVTAVRGTNSASASIYYRINPLENVGGFTVEGSVLHFHAVPHAKKYLITAICADSGHRIENLAVTDPQYDFSGCAMGAGGITIRVTAVAEGYANSLTSEKTITNADLGLASSVVTLNKGSYGTLAETTAAATQGFPFVLPVPVADPAAGYHFAGWYADTSYNMPLTNAAGQGLGLWDKAGSVQAYACWVTDVFAYNLTTVGGLEAYEISAGKNFGRLSSVTIPSVYDGKPVARIQAAGFANQSLIAGILIPDTVVEIGDGAFKGCSRLTELSIYDAGNSSDTYVSMDGVLFAIDRYTNELSLFKMPEGRTGGYVIPDNVVGIAGKAFEGSGITEVTISASVTGIGVEAFINSQLKQITFASGGESLMILDRAFMNTKLTEIQLPARLTSIALKRLEVCEVTSNWSTSIEPVTDISKATDAFYGCTELKTITVEAGNTTYKAIDNVLFSADAKTLLYAPYTLSAEYTVPANTQTIADGAFYGTAVTKVTIANTVTHIGEGAFFASTTLTTVQFSELPSVGAITIGRYAFGSTSVIKNALTEFIVNDNTKIQTICDYAFYYSQNLKEIHISQFTTHIGQEAFAFCRGAISVDFSVGNEIRETELVIGDDAFKNVPVETITIGSSLKEFPVSAFAETSRLKEILVAEDHETLISIDGVLYTKVGGRAHTLILFPDGKGGAFVIPEGVVEIGDNVFSNKAALQSVTIPASVTKIGTGAFLQGWETALTEIIFSNTAAPGAELTIGDKAFYNAGLVASITLPAHTKRIGENAFYQLGSRTDGMVTITLNEGLESIGASAFAKTRIASIVIPSTVKNIGQSAFANLTTLTAVTFAANSQLTEIGEKAFFGCPIAHVQIPASVEVIRPFAFGSGITLAEDENGDLTVNYSKAAGGVKAVTFESGSKLTTICAFAFAGSQLQSIVIPQSVTFIGAYAFAGCYDGSNDLNSVVFEDGGTQPLMLGTAAAVTVSVGEGAWAVRQEYMLAGFVFDKAQLTTLELPVSREVHADENAFAGCKLPE